MQIPRTPKPAPFAKPISGLFKVGIPMFSGGILPHLLQVSMNICSNQQKYLLSRSGQDGRVTPGLASTPDRVSDRAMCTLLARRASLASSEIGDLALQVVTLPVCSTGGYVTHCELPNSKPRAPARAPPCSPRPFPRRPPRGPAGVLSRALQL